MEALLKELSPERKHQCRMWADMLADQDLDNEEDLVSLSDRDFAMVLEMIVSPMLKKILRIHCDRQPTREQVQREQEQARQQHKEGR
jgi:hypothetical protein